MANRCATAYCAGMTKQAWQTPALAALIEKCYATIESEPTVLLEHDGGPYGLAADIVVARLYGFDEQLDHEWRIPRIESELRTPIMPRLSAVPSDVVASPMTRTGRYVLQSNYASANIAGEYVVPLAPWKPAVSVLCLRYRRRS